jgi:hypothetical protein
MTPARVQERFERIADIPDQMEVIHDPEGVRGCHAALQGKRIGTIAGWTCMPLDQGLSRAALQHGYGLPAFEIHQQGGRGTAAAQRELIHAQDPRCGEDERLLALPTNQGVWARDISQPAREACAHLCATSMG